MKTHSIISPQCAKSVRISHLASSGGNHEIVETISADSSELKLIGALQLAMANLFLSRPYNTLELLSVLEIAKSSPKFKATMVKQDFPPAPPAKPYVMVIEFIENKAKIKVSVDIGDKKILHAGSAKENHPKTIEMICFLEEEYLTL